MLDKDKLILLFNLDISEYEPEDVYDVTQQTVKQFKGWFDDSVKCIFAVTKNSDKPTVENITDFPSEGLSLIENLIEMKDSGNEEAFNVQLEAVREFIKTYKNERN